MAALCLGREGHEVGPSVVTASASSSEPKTWLGTTSKEWDASITGPEGPGFKWSRGDAAAFQVRCGPDYATMKGKAPSAPAMYECIGVDVVRAGCPVKQVLTRLVPVPSRGREWWRKGCMLPRILCIVTQLPYTTRGPSANGVSNDPGCSVVATFAITQAAVQAASAEVLPPAVRMMRDFSAAAGGQCNTDAGSMTPGVIKAIAIGENVKDMQAIPTLMQPAVYRYNGTPTLITRSGCTYRDPEGEWLEIDIDVRYWAYAARNALYYLRGCMPDAIIHLGFLVQAAEDDDMPEGIIGACRIHGLDIMESPKLIDDPDDPDRRVDILPNPDVE